MAALLGAGTLACRLEAVPGVEMCQEVTKAWICATEAGEGQKNENQKPNMVSGLRADQPAKARKSAGLGEAIAARPSGSLIFRKQGGRGGAASAGKRLRQLSSGPDDFCRQPSAERMKSIRSLGTLGKALCCRRVPSY